jgi:hypothetical protein
MKATPKRSAMIQTVEMDRLADQTTATIDARHGSAARLQAVLDAYGLTEAEYLALVQP